MHLSPAAKDAAVRLPDRPPSGESSGSFGDVVETERGGDVKPLGE
jgi:hypothetical protein